MRNRVGFRTHRETFYRESFETVSSRRCSEYENVLRFKAAEKHKLITCGEGLPYFQYQKRVFFLPESKTKPELLR